MANYFQQVLDRSDPMFVVALRRLEEVTGRKGIDAHFIGESIVRAHHIMRLMGLDPADTTAHELYESLAANAHNDVLFEDSEDIGIVIDGEVISFNLDDINDNAERPFELRTKAQLKCHVAQELVYRYEHHTASGSRAADELIERAGLNRCAHEHNHKLHTSKSTRKVKPSVLVTGDIGVATTMSVPDDGDGDTALTLRSGATVIYTDTPAVYGAGSAGTIATRLAHGGLTSTLATWVGGDAFGKATLAALTAEGVNAKNVRIVKHSETQRYITLSYTVGAMTFVRAGNVDYAWTTPTAKQDWVVLTAMHSESWEYVQDVVRYVQSEHTAAKLLVYPGYEQLKWAHTKLRTIFHAADFVFLSIEDTRQLLRRQSADVAEMIVSLRNYGVTRVAVMDSSTGTVHLSMGHDIVIAEYKDKISSLYAREWYDEYVASFIEVYVREEDSYQALERATFDRNDTSTNHDRVTIKEQTHL